MAPRVFRCWGYVIIYFLFFWDCVAVYNMYIVFQCSASVLYYMSKLIFCVLIHFLFAIYFTITIYCKLQFMFFDFQYNDIMLLCYVMLCYRMYIHETNYVQIPAPTCSTI